VNGLIGVTGRVFRLESLSFIEHTIIHELLPTGSGSPIYVGYPYRECFLVYKVRYAIHVLTLSQKLPLLFSFVMT